MILKEPLQRRIHGLCRSPCCTYQRRHALEVDIIELRAGVIVSEKIRGLMVCHVEFKRRRRFGDELRIATEETKTIGFAALTPGVGANVLQEGVAYAREGKKGVWVPERDSHLQDVLL